MSTFDKEHDPLAEQTALAEHIEMALAAKPPAGRELELSYRMAKLLFRPTVVGAERIPDRPCLFIGNHSLFALDGMVIAPVFQKELGRFVRGMGDRFLFSSPGLGKRILRMGGVMGHPEVCSALMEAGQDILVFPGGAHEAVKPASEIYALQWKERYGFVKLALKHGYTIMPFGIVGPDEFYGHLMEGHELPDSALGKLLRQLGLLTDETRTDMLPPIPVGALGTLMPKPQACYLGFGEPVETAEFSGRRQTRKLLSEIRAKVAQEIEEQLADMLLLREQNRDRDGLLRRLLTF